MKKLLILATILIGCSQPKQEPTKEQNEWAEEQRKLDSLQAERQRISDSLDFEIELSKAKGK